MSRNIRVIFAILILIFSIFLYQVIRFYWDENHVLVKNDPETLTVSALGGGYYSFAQRGFYGVKNSEFCNDDEEEESRAMGVRS